MSQIPLKKVEKQHGAYPPHANGQLIDLFDRTISYLRVSLTDQCNLRCVYCSPKEISEKLTCSELLRYEEILRVVEIAVQLGIRKVRLTGGEPLVRKNVVSFIKRLAAIPLLDDIRLTTNGVMLEQLAHELYRGGIRKLNISLDTMHRDRYKKITGVDLFDRVWRGIEKVQEIGFSPIKINVVAVKGVNDDEFVDFARLAMTTLLKIRFIEFMPIGQETIWGKENYISANDIKEMLRPLGELIPVKEAHMDGPAQIFRLKGETGEGSVGFISAISHKFCDRCNRLRLTSEGKLRSCLLSDKETDLKKLLRAGASDEDIKQALIETILSKPKGHTILEEDGLNCHGQMSRIGG